MKRIFIFLCVVLPFTAISQVEFAIFGGPQMTSANYKANSVKQTTEHKFGIFAGGGWKIPFESNLYFAPEIFYSLKGYKVVFNQFLFPPGTDAKDNNTTIHSVEVAGLLQADLGSQPSHFFLKGGLSLDFQLFGNEKFNTISGEKVDRKMKYDFGEYGHYSANAILQFGYESANGFFVAGRYSYGVANISNADDGPNIHHVVFGVSAGFYFKKNKIVINTRNRE
jgi:hypothetical protein